MDGSFGEPLIVSRILHSNIPICRTSLGVLRSNGMWKRCGVVKKQVRQCWHDPLTEVLLSLCIPF